MSHDVRSARRHGARTLAAGIASLIVACSIYDPSLLSGPGAAGAPGSDGGLGGMDPASGGASGGSDDSGGSGASDDSGGDGSGGDGSGGDDSSGGSNGSGGSTSCGAPDCCPEDPDKIEPGECGCGVPEQDCLTLKNSLIHRYSFNGTGTEVMDSKGTAHGAVLGGAELSGTGTLTLAGGAPGTNDQYVELPTGCLDDLDNATFEAWLDWPDTGNAWQRVFDFGELSTGTSGSYLFLSPRASSNAVRVGFSAADGASGEIVLDGPSLAAGFYHLAVVVDDDNDRLYLYVDGQDQGNRSFPEQLTVINDVHCWLGRSQYASDHYLAATFHEFRVYSAALTAAQVLLSYEQGPSFQPYDGDPVPGSPGEQ